MKVLLSLALTMMATACLGEIHSLAPARINAREGVLCRGPPQTSQCLLYIDAYHYDVESGTCKYHVFGGCGGTKNNFFSMKECQKTCHPTAELCRGPPESGPQYCKAYIDAYHYDVESGTCKHHVYGGCGATKNNFFSMEECERTCDPTAEVCRGPPCLLCCEPMGPPWGFDAHHYDVESGTCKPHFDGGCDDTPNNFKSKEECEKTCLPKTDDGVAGKASKLIKKPLSELKALKTRRKFALGQKVEQAEATDAKRKYTFLEECCHEAPCSKEEVVELAASGQDISREMKKYHWCRP